MTQKICACRPMDTSWLTANRLASLVMNLGLVSRLPCLALAFPHTYHSGAMVTVLGPARGIYFQEICQGNKENIPEADMLL